MPKVSFQATGADTEVDAASAIIDICDEVDSGIMFGCRSGVCGTCLTTVVEGELAAPSEEEKETLQAIGAEPNQRLSCQARVGGSDVVLDQQN